MFTSTLFGGVGCVFQRLRLKDKGRGGFVIFVFERDLGRQVCNSTIFRVTTGTCNRIKGPPLFIQRNRGINRNLDKVRVSTIAYICGKAF